MHAEVEDRRGVQWYCVTRFVFEAVRNASRSLPIHTGVDPNPAWKRSLASPWWSMTGVAGVRGDWITAEKVATC
jgi:hypothetical protein